MKIRALQVPNKEQLVDQVGAATRYFELFLRNILDLLLPLGSEYSVNLENNIASATDIVGLTFKKDAEIQSFIEYVIQRTSTSGQLIESGILQVVYLPFTDSWSIGAAIPSGPNSAGVTFSITSAGQVQYTSSNYADQNKFKISMRVRKLTGKNTVRSGII